MVRSGPVRVPLVMVRSFFCRWWSGPFLFWPVMVKYSFIKIRSGATLFWPRSGPVRKNRPDVRLVKISGFSAVSGFQGFCNIRTWNHVWCGKYLFQDNYTFSDRLRKWNVWILVWVSSRFMMPTSKSFLVSCCTWRLYNVIRFIYTYYSTLGIVLFVLLIVVLIVVHRWFYMAIRCWTKSISPVYRTHISWTWGPQFFFWQGLIWCGVSMPLVSRWPLYSGVGILL